MGRPKSVRDHEAARGAEVPIIDPGHADDLVDASRPLARQNEPVDKPGEVLAISPSASEADDVFVPIAKKAGWVELENWTRDPKDHLDARTFVERLPEVYAARDAAREERVERFSKVAEAAAEEARRSAVREAEQRLREAHQRGDEEAVVRVGQELAQSRPHPQTVAWMSQNPWFRTDEDARALAVLNIQRAERSGASVEDQLKAGEDAVRTRFPEHFGGSPRPMGQAPTLANVAPPPQVQGGSRGTAPRASLEKGWADIPPQDRRTYERSFMRPMLRNGLNQEDAQKALAKAYWGVGTRGAPA